MKKGCKKKKGVKHEVWSAQSVKRLNLDQTVTSNFSQTTIKTMVIIVSILAFNTQQSLTQILNDSLSSLPTFLTFK